jgi:hypothetical protein
MRARVVSTRVIGMALVVLCWLSASGSLAGDGTTGEFGPVRQWVAQREGVLGVADVPIGPVTPLRTPLLSRSHAEQGAIVGAVVLGVMGGLCGAGMAAYACQEADSHGSCDETLLYAAAGAAGGALVGGAVGGLVGSLFQAAPWTPAPSSPARTRVRILPRRGGIGIALSHSF